MVRRLTKTGNSLSLTIPRPVLELLRITPETDLDISTDGRQLVIKPVDPHGPAFKEALDRVIQNHGATLKKLAE